MDEHFPEFAVPLKSGDAVERLVRQADVPYERTNTPEMTVFTFSDEADHRRAGGLVMAVYDDEITKAIHKAINGQLTPDEAIWADWESFYLPGVPEPEKRQRPMPRTLSMDDVLDAFNSANRIEDPERRKRALAHVAALRKKLESS